MKLLKYTFLPLLFFCSSINAEEQPGQLDLSAETDVYIAIFTTGTDYQKRQAAEDLIWSGLSNTALFDLIEQDLLLQYNTVTDAHRSKADLLVWELKALAASGQDKYLETFNLLVKQSNSKKMRKYGPTFKGYFKQYAHWNPIITSIAGDIGEVDNAEARYINMLRSGHLELMRIAAQRIYYTYNQNEQVLDVAAEQLLIHSVQEEKNKLWLDTLAWICKALAASDKSKYTEILQYVAENATNKKLVQYANKNLMLMRP